MSTTIDELTCMDQSREPDSTLMRLLARSKAAENRLLAKGAVAGWIRWTEPVAGGCPNCGSGGLVWTAYTGALCKECGWSSQHPEVVEDEVEDIIAPTEYKDIGHLPYIACSCERCKAAYADLYGGKEHDCPSERQRATSLPKVTDRPESPAEESNVVGQGRIRQNRSTRQPDAPVANPHAGTTPLTDVSGNPSDHTDWGQLEKVMAERRRVL